MVDRTLWALVFAIIVASIAGYYYFAERSLWIRSAGLLSAGVVAIVLAMQTRKGRNFWSEWLEAVQEVRKMHWPTRPETVQTTIAVLAMAFVMGLLLWATDFVLLRIVAWLTGHWGA